MQRRSELQVQIGKLLRELVGLAMYPQEDPCEDGDVIWFEKEFPGGTRYTYVVVKAGGKFYTTATRSPNVFNNWDALCSWMGTHVDAIYRMHRADEPFIDSKTASKEFMFELRDQLVDRIER